jgi:methylmalonyl-CoA/ethylmalonyl-CoA epimerase
MSDAASRSGGAAVAGLRGVLGLPPRCQVGLVIPDLEQAIALYEPLFGEFEIVARVEIDGALHPGRTGPSRIRMGMGHTCDPERELVEWVSGETPHEELLDPGRSGMHHLSFRVLGLDAVAAAAKALGYELAGYRARSDDIEYAYLERPGVPLLIELSQRPWDGGNVRLD